MERQYFKVINVETGEELLTAIPPAVPVISRQKLAPVLKYDHITGFYAAVFGAIHPGAIMAVAKGDMTPDEFNLAMVTWMLTWEPQLNGTYDKGGNEIKPTRPEESDSDADPLP